MAFSDAIRQQVCLKLETTFGTVPTFAASNYCAVISASTNPTFADDERPDKTGSYSQPAPVPGDQSGTWDFSCTLAPNGAAGSPPDSSPIFESGLGGKTISAGVSVTYGPSNTAAPSFSLFNINNPSTMDQEIAVGCVPSQFSIAISGDSMPILSANGPCQWVIQQAMFGSLTSAYKGGLSSFPSAPTSPVYNGAPVPKRKGNITLNGVVYDTFLNGTYTCNTGKSLTEPKFGSNIPRDIQNGRRTVAFEWMMYDDDSSSLNALKVLAFTKAKQPYIAQLGNVAGSIATFNMPAGTLSMPNYDRSKPRQMVKFRIFVSESANGAADETSVVFT